MLVRFKALLLSLLLLCVMGAAQAEEPEMQAVPLRSEYLLVAENDRLALYLREDIMAIIIQSKTTGQKLFSAVQNPEDMRDNAKWKGFYQSGIVLEYSENANHSLFQAELLNTEHQLTYTYQPDGFTAQITFPGPQISCEVNVTLDELGVHVFIPKEKLIEENESVYKVNTIQMFPFLGHSYQGGDAGYMFIPDGQGALIELRNNNKAYSNAYTQQVYGENVGVQVTNFNQWTRKTENILMPVFGMVHTEKEIGFLGVIEEGDASAQIKAYPNGVITQFDWITAQFIYRQIYSQPTVINDDQESYNSAIYQATASRREFDVRLHYYVVEGTEANYAGLAKVYRNYLEQQGAFANSDMSKDFLMQLDFVGLEKENDLFGRKSVVMTSFEQTGEILADLYDAGAQNLLAVLRGWQKDGLTGGLPVKDYSPAVELGGQAGMEQLRADAAALGVTVMPETDFMQLNLDENPELKNATYQKATGTSYRYPTYKKVYEYINFLSPVYSQRFAEQVLEELTRAEWQAVALNGITSFVSDYKAEKVYYDTTSMMAIYEQICQDSGEDLALSLSNANAYLWQYADMLYGMPVEDSDFVLSSRSVPFLAITLSGKMHYTVEYANFQANYRKFFLQMIEQGAFPSFVLTWESPVRLINTNANDLFSTQYEQYRDMILEWYAEMEPVYRQFKGASIEQHQTSGKVTKVTWSNGVVVYLNYGTTNQSVDGYTLEGLSYKVVNGHE